MAAPRRAGELRPAVTASLWMRQLRQFFRENPEVLVLLIVCVVLGLGTFLAVVFGLISAGTARDTGQPSGVIVLSLLAV